MRVRIFELRLIGVALVVCWTLTAALVLLAYRPGGPIDVIVGVLAFVPLGIAILGVVWPPVVHGRRSSAPYLCGRPGGTTSSSGRSRARLGRWVSARRSSVDAGMPPTYDGSQIGYVDFDLDVMVRPNGCIELLDQDNSTSTRSSTATPATSSRARNGPRPT